MKFNRYSWRLLLKVLVLFTALLLTAFIIAGRHYNWLFLLMPLTIYLVINLARFQQRAENEIREFVESIHYRDFSRHFDVGKAPAELKPLRQEFNKINDIIKLISRERETQYHYMQKILELVDTGIISYEVESGATNLINESFQKLLGIPYLKTIHALKKREPGLYNDITGLKPGESKLVSVIRDQQQIKIIISANLLRSDNLLYKLIAFQNVSEALDETESKAWQKLLNVMTHEIMNSVAPISSLAETLKNRLQSPAILDKIASSELEDLELGIDTIRHRSEGLLKFTESYRNLNKITQLALTHTLVSGLFENISSLMLPSLEKKSIEFEVIIKDLTLAVDIDINLIEQVLINLLVNAIEAVKDNPAPRIILSAELLHSKKIGIKITDNGTGIPAELLDKIFIPFFSTRKTGSGIGLSLCKQIMLLHRGNIQVQSVEGKGSAFLLQFNAN